ncbi:MAG: LPS export ABC transporter periplasmic protein LptC [Alphaproteobacteria bacterium]|nr:MAG: LPS export ABC transporter periplasmic protein LptC [Alphaproteobacteria bacterium]
MSEQADQDRIAKRGWAAPGGMHDRLMRLLKVVLPAAVGVLLAYLFLSPLQKSKEISFLLDKNKVEVAKERLRLQQAQYRGQDNEGRPFTIAAGQAVQASSKDPVVNITGMQAQMQLQDGPAQINADKARYDMDGQKVDVLGPVTATGPEGYKLETSDVRVDFNTKTMHSTGRVQGRMRLGTFSADRMEANLGKREVALKGRARLHINQGAAR